MNLAEIRKKAQQAKDLPVTPAVLSPEPDRFPGEQVVPGESAPAIPEVKGPILAVEVIPEPERIEAQSPPLPQSSPQPSRWRSFDPMAVLLAGRECAGLEEERGVAAGEVAETVDEDVEEYLCFRVATEKYAINIMEIKEIIKPREVTEVPRMPPFVPGIISLRGVIIPLFDMRLRLALPEGEPTSKERVIVVKNGEGLCGVLVDEVIQVVRINVAAIEQPPTVLEGIDRDFVHGIGRFDEKMLILLNLGNILDLKLR